MQASPAFATSSLQELKETVGATSSEHASQVLADAQENVTAVANTLVEDTKQLFDTSIIETIPGDTTNAPDSTQRSNENPAATNLDIASDTEALERTAPGTTSLANDAIVVDGDTVTIQGDCTTTDIYNVMRKSGGAGINATNLHFSGSIAITTEHSDSSDSPFAQTKLHNITAEQNATVTFVAKVGANAPTLSYMFYGCTNLESINGLSVWNVSNVVGATCFMSMFDSCSSLTSLDGLESWDVSNLAGDYCMYFMFAGCEKLISLDGLSNWDVSNLTGKYCMSCMFTACNKLTSLDALSNWNVSNVSGENCMAKMFEMCSGLISLDGIASWNLAKAIASYQGTALMFDICKNLSSLTVNPNEGFQLNSNMDIPSTFDAGGNYWWPVKGADKGIATDALYDASKNTDTYGTRWVRSEENVNPYVSGVIPTVTWTTIAKPYTGFNQTIGPDKVEVEGTELKAGVDYTVLYTKNTTQKNTEVASPVVRDKGAYTAELYLQGIYIAQEEPSYKQTVYVTEPDTVVLTFNAAGGTFASTGDSLLGLVNQTAGQAIASVEEPTRVGYEFSGWKDASGSTVIFPLTVPATDASYSATWTAEPGPGPTPPGPTPGPTPDPTPTPDINPATDGTLLPLTGDVSANAGIVVYLAFAALLAFLGVCALKKERA